MVSVILPALNEEKTITDVIQFCFSDPVVSEVIVVDDQSEDNTRERARAAGARVITSAVRGKGYSMFEGVHLAAEKFVVFLDADIHPYPDHTIRSLTWPLLTGTADFVKGAFSRNAGRVTELVARPLLGLFYPELARFHQPLSGMIAGTKHLFQKIRFANGYGVDIGILIDMFMMQVRIVEKNIGYITNKSKPWDSLGKMSREVAETIIQKSRNQGIGIHGAPDSTGSLPGNTADMNNQPIHNHQHAAGQKLVAFDLDGTLFNGRYIDSCATAFGFEDKLKRLRMTIHDPAVLTKHIARLLTGIPLSELLQIAAGIPLVPDAAEIIGQLKKEGYKTGIISDSYQFVVEYVKHKLDMDFALGNRLDFYEGKATGEVIIPSAFYYHKGSLCNHPVCKTNALQFFSNRFGIPVSDCVTIGDGGNDYCMIQKAGTGIAFCSTSQSLHTAADYIIEQPSFRELPGMIDRQKRSGFATIAQKTNENSMNGSDHAKII